MEVVQDVTQRSRCPDCNGFLTTLYRQERVGGREGKLSMTKAPWLECKTCDRVYPA